VEDSQFGSFCEGKLYLAAIAGGSTEGAFERTELEPKEPADNVAVPDVGVEEVDRFHCSLAL
jgi:hypothetical protein